MKGLQVKPAATPQISNKLMADQIAAKLNAKLGHVPLDRDENSSVKQVISKTVFSYIFQSFATIDGLYQTTYEEELEINDFPQSCRWKVTSREAIGNITDYSEADIQIRGVYYPPGKEPGEGEERKLFLLITGRVFT